MGVGIVLKTIVTVLLHRGMRGQPLQPLFVIVVQAGFVVIDS